MRARLISVPQLDAQLALAMEAGNLQLRLPRHAATAGQPDVLGDCCLRLTLTGFQLTRMAQTL